MKKVLFILMTIPFLMTSCQEDFIEKVDKNGLNSDRLDIGQVLNIPGS